jgi:hypothetical protein
MLLNESLNFFSINVPFLYGFSEYDEDGYPTDESWHDEEDDDDDFYGDDFDDDDEE